MNYKNLPSKSEGITDNGLIFSLKKAIALAFDRTRSEPFDISSMVQDILTEFPRVKEADLISAIRNGGLGMYGRTFRLSTQEVCYWIRQYTNPKQQEKL